MQKFALMFVLAFAAVLVWPKQTIALAKGAVNSLEYYIDSSGAQLTKLEAGKKLLLNKGENVWRCYQVQMSDKLTLTKKK